MSETNQVYDVIETFGIEQWDDLEQELILIKKEIPYIDWRIQQNNSENIDDQLLLQFAVLEVPIEQYTDAVKVFQMYKKGLDVTTYVPKGAYPGLYMYEDGQWILNSQVKELLNLLDYIDYSLYYGVDSVLDTLHMLAETFSGVYSKFYQLPQVDCSECHICLGETNTIEVFKRKDIEEYYFTYRVDLLTISDLVNTILYDLTKFEYFHEQGSASQNQVAEMIYGWQNFFLEKDGWGMKIVQLLFCIQQALVKIEHYYIDDFLKEEPYV